ncbi:hypothetical protein OIV83_000931 [Microbotryomycetes sp. JL201]|nr:hypothetical protein OIV83_000931 [Microbotryomycetes sp. JL201]
MPTETEAWVVFEKGSQFERAAVTLDDPLDDEVLVEIAASGICHTDFLVAQALLPGATFPVILGHEGSGKVLAVGKSVSTIVPGDHVLLSFAYCNDCEACRGETPHACANWGMLNFGKVRSNGSVEVGTLKDGRRVHGAFFGQSSFAKHTLAKETSCVKVSPDTDLVSLAPMGCGMQTGAGAVLNVAQPRPQDSVMVSGLGAVGMAALFAAKQSKVELVIAVDMNDDRLEMARSFAASSKPSKTFGATHTINPRSVDTVTEVKRLTRGRGVDFAIECSGNVHASRSAFMSLALQGKQVQVGDSGVGELSVPLAAFLQGLRTIVGCVEGNCTPSKFIPQLVQLSQEGKFPLQQISTRYKWEDFAQAEHDAHTGTIIKAILVV